MRAASAADLLLQGGSNSLGFIAMTMISAPLLPTSLARHYILPRWFSRLRARRVISRSDCGMVQSCGAGDPIAHIAQSSLAHMYFEGLGVTQGYAGAVK